MLALLAVRIDKRMNSRAWRKLFCASAESFEARDRFATVAIT